MRVTIYQRLIDPKTQKPVSVEYGRVDLVDGKVVFTPEELKREILSEGLFVEDLPFNPKDGAAFLELLPELFRGAHSYAVLEK